MSTPTRSDPSLRSHIADLLDVWVTFMAADGYPAIRAREGEELADALLADPTLAAIIDLAASVPIGRHLDDVSPEVRALLADWRAER